MSDRGASAAAAASRSRVDTSPEVSDEVKYTTCYMCACRCGIKVHLKDGAIRYIQGNRNHPVNKGVLCAKGSAGIMQQYSPARLTKPLKRVGERGAAEFQAAPGLVLPHGPYLEGEQERLQIIRIGDVVVVQQEERVG